MQRGELRKTKWGLGFFLLESAKAGDLIIGMPFSGSVCKSNSPFKIEYVGDMIYEPTIDSRECVFVTRVTPEYQLMLATRRPVAEHLKRHYVFNLNSSLAIDASVAGNESKYINHVHDSEANARADSTSIHLFNTKKGGREHLQ
jgi:hypothetical protein